MLRLPDPYRPGWYVRQQVTGYLHPRIGVALGFARGGSSHTAALLTRDPARPLSDPFPQPDPARLRGTYARQETLSDLSLVLLPVLTRRHQVKVQVGLSAYKRREIRVDSIVYPTPGIPYYEQLSRVLTEHRAVPMLSAGYDFRPSARWSVGVVASFWFTGDRQPTSTLGLRTAYRFNLPGDSLGIPPLRWNELRYGLRGGGNLTAVNNRGPGGLYRLRFTAGLWADIPLSLSWSLRGEINYSQRGYRSRETQLSLSSRSGDAWGNLNYLELPLLFRHEVAPRWHLYGGPMLSIFLNGQTEAQGQPTETVRPHTVSGVALGTTCRLSDRLFADLRYQRDLLRLSSQPYGGLHAIQLTAGYTLH